MSHDPASYSAMTPRHAHACNCIGCCRKCGTCRTWPGHTPEYCALIVRQLRERLAMLDRPRSLQLPGEP